jgi:hypothetical protein
MRNPFNVTDEEYFVLEEKFEKLSNFQAWQLFKKNSKNNHTNDLDDITQELRMYILIAGQYYKRQVYIERSLELACKHAQDRFMKYVVKELSHLWDNRKRHGASRQKFGPFQEKLLDKIIRTTVPARLRPSKKDPLRVDSKFKTYCKAITWNRLKMLGKNITKEKSIRSGLVSLSEFDYLVSE